MIKEAKIKKTNLKLIIFLILIIVLLCFLFNYLYDYSINVKHDYRRIDTGKNIREALIEKEQKCKIQLKWDLDFDYVEEIKLTFHDEKYNKYDYITYKPSYDLEISSSDLGLESFEEIAGVEAKYVYGAQWPSPNQTNSTETPSLPPRKNLLDWIKSLF